ncbi:chemotaxis protein CheY [Aneurinibacillus aneurinilyticus ATCC 12856]|jgi:two-component system chemotaxis response regulator CheY|uniref:Chemotaxis protein CheY n=2 Tax=Aneurinibacillus aneurinilyticus TaxID=1391 RepID=U1X5K7_ANEAE|nr:chemotaxis protein CheY [Aneurinibacillus aneurinilyticus ATCC 12856]
MQRDSPFYIEFLVTGGDVHMHKVLVVDDAVFMRNIIKDFLTKNGFEVVGEAGNGAEAVQKYIQTRPDLVTMDITMPEMDGVEALKKIKEHDPLAKIIICSAMGQEKMVIQAMGAGAIDFIVKPFQEARVLEAITKAAASL